MSTTPATTAPSPGTTAAPTAGATGAVGVESTPAAQTSTQQPSPADIIAAFVGGEEKPASQAETTPPGEEELSTTSAEAAEAGNGEGEGEGDGESGGTTDNADGGDGKSQGQLDHLIDGLLKDPENKGIRSRISKLLAEPATLKRQLEEANAKLKDVEGPPILVGKASVEDPLAGIATVAQLDQALKGAQAWRDWCEDHPEGGQTDPNDEKSEVSAEQVKATLRYVRKQLEAAPAKREYIGKLNASREKLRASHPDLFVKDSPLFAEAVKLLEDGVITAGTPDYMEHAMDLLEGRKARLEREAGKTHITIDPKKAAKAASGTPGSKASTQRPAPGGGGVTKTPATRPAGAEADLGELRKQSLAGNVKAKAALIDQFVG